MNLDTQVKAIANRICHLLVLRGEGYTLPSYRWVEISLVATKRQLTNMNVIQAILGNLIQGGFLELDGSKVIQRIEVTKSNFNKVYDNVVFINKYVLGWYTMVICINAITHVSNKYYIVMEFIQITRNSYYETTIHNTKLESRQG